MLAIIIDTETTGLPSSQYAHPVSVGAVCIDTTSGAETSQYEGLVLPNVVNISEYRRAARIHGITLESLLREGKPALKACADLRGWWMGLGKPMLYAYNVSFDQEMIRRMGWDPKGYWGPCLMRASARAMDRTSGRVSLSHAAKYFGNLQRAGQHHSALEDARLAASVGLAAGAFR